MYFNTKALAFTSGVIWGGALLFVGLANLAWADYGVVARPGANR